MGDTMIEHADKLHLFAACVQTLCETRTYVSRLAALGDREAKSLLERVDAVIARVNDASRGSGKREATEQG
jgi:hypothetical protein